MQNLQDIQDKIFFEIKTILETLGKISSVDELLAKQDSFSEVADRIAFLRILEKNEEGFGQTFSDAQTTENIQTEGARNQISEQEAFDDATFPEDIIEEEVLFTNELNNIDPDDLENSPIITESDTFPEEEILVSPIQEEFSEAEQQLNESAAKAERIAQRERELEESEVRRRQIVEINRQEPAPVSVVEEKIAIPDTPLQQAEKKFKLANIKGLKAVQQIFDNDPLENEAEGVVADQGSILKTNIKTDFMEAERRKPEFRLDLNDKVAFTKSLFNGNSEELTAAITKLNSFATLDEAKNYLSDLYHERNWSKADEYAQRLWSLVENKFM